MRWFKGQYVLSLEVEVSRLRKELADLRDRQTQLVERMLRQGGVPTVGLPPEPTKEALDRMLQSHDIFEDIEDLPTKDNLVDNRKEQFDEFVS